jgi:pimeloyl-ACP methyl ester carboxylesterase
MGPHDVPGLTDGINPGSARFFRLNRDRPVIGRLLDRLMALSTHRDPERLMSKTLSALPSADRAAMGVREVAEAYVDALRECLRPGPRGAQVDTSLMVSPWDFDPHDIQAPVSLWHGDRDTDAPAAMGRWLAQAIPECRARFLDEGHISLIVNHAESILRSIAE